MIFVRRTNAAGAYRSETPSGSAACCGVAGRLGSAPVAPGGEAQAQRVELDKALGVALVVDLIL
jgi:hypothetical protein